MTQICPQCQANNDDNVIFCFRCGARLDQHTDTIIADFGSLQASQEEEQRKKLLVPALAGCAVFLCLVVIVVVVVVYLNRDQAEELSPATETPTLSVQVPADTPSAEPDTPTPESPPLSTMTPSPSPEPLPTHTPTESLPTPNQYGLRVGIQVQVFTTEGDTLRMRDTPNTQGQIVEYLSKGTLLMIVDGPQKDAGGLTWWQVRTSDGLIGWCVEFVDGIQTLVP